MQSDTGEVMKKASPGLPVQITGWKEMPLAGDEVLQATGEVKL